MRLPAWAWLALSSLLAWPAGAATRPHYGGALTIELSTPWTSLDPTELHTALEPRVAETLVRRNANGAIEPELAVAWQPDPDRKRWRFTLRPRVLFHDGGPLNASTAAPALLAALKSAHPDLALEVGGQTVVLKSEHPMPDLLAELAAQRTAIFRKSDTGLLIATGPFRVAAWEPGRRLSLAAFDDYWGGRPYLDAVNISFGDARARPDVFDIPAGPSRRILPESARVWSSVPRQLVALVAANVPPELLQALALSVDRAPIVNVLTQRRGEPAFALLPQWLSGYAFLFQAAPDLSRAKQIAASLRASMLTLSYPPNDPFLRSVAERVALNARDAGINLQPTPSQSGSLRLVAWPLESADAAAELSRLAGLLGLADRTASLDASKPESLFQAETSLLADHRVIPLVYLPETYGLAPRVHLPSTKPAFRLALEDLWVDP